MSYLRKNVCVAVTAVLVSLSSAGVSFAKDNPTEPQSDSFYCQERGLGDYFYCKPPAVEEEVKEEPAAAPAPVDAEPPKDEDIADLERFQVILDDSRKKAVWNPTKDNVRAFMQNQIIMADKADKFSNVFTRLGWQEPELSYNVKNPVNRAGLQTFRYTERQARLTHMKGLSDRYGVYYFYAKNCAACEVFSPILQVFSRMHGVKVVAVSMDGGPNGVFRDWRPNNGIAEALGLQNSVTPAVLLFDAETSETIPVSFGVISVEELEDRIFALTGGENKTYLGDL